MKLTDATVRNAKAGSTPRKLSDGGGLFLLLSTSGAKLWRFRYRFAGAQRDFAIGQYPDITLAEAREMRRWAKEVVKQGRDPTHERRVERQRLEAEAANTFEAVTREWMTARGAHWSPYYRGQVRRFFERDAFPSLGRLAVRSVTPADILDVLKRVEGRGARTVARLGRQWISAVFRYAVATLRADSDPVATLKGALAPHRVKHRRPLERDDIATFLTRLERYGGYRPTVIAFRLLLLTFVRPVELRAAGWHEFDFERAQWTVPGERMKMRTDHVVPLSRQALALLHELRTHTGGRPLLFPNLRNPRECMSATTLNRALERMGYGGSFSAHGFRATASTLLNEQGFRSDLIERQLAHQERNRVRNAYNRAEYLAERREMLQSWADFIDAIAEPRREIGNVVPLRARARG